MLTLCITITSTAFPNEDLTVKTFKMSFLEERYACIYKCSLYYKFTGVSAVFGTLSIYKINSLLPSVL